MKSQALILSLVLTAGFSATADTLLFSDNFNTSDGPLDSSSLDGRLDGAAAGETSLQSFRIQQAITNDQLDLKANGNGGGVRFGGQTSRYDWAGSTTGPAILAGGGFTVSFDWTFTASSNDDWIAFKVGTPNADSNVNASDVDYTILLRHNGGNEIFDNGADLSDTGINFNPTLGLTTVPVSLTYNFDSFADGSLVTVTASVNGITILDGYSFTWDGNNGSLYMELFDTEPTQTNYIDNLAVTTVPEPGATGLLSIAGAAFLVARRRFRNRR